MSTWDHINVQARMDIGGLRTQLKRHLIAFGVEMGPKESEVC